MTALLLEVRRMRAAGALFCDDSHRGWSDSSQTKFGVFLVVLSCAGSEPLRRQCNAKLDVAGIYADALEVVPETMDGQPPMPLEREPGHAGRPASAAAAMSGRAGRSKVSARRQFDASAPRSVHALRLLRPECGRTAD